MPAIERQMFDRRDERGADPLPALDMESAHQSYALTGIEYVRHGQAGKTPEARGGCAII